MSDEASAPASSAAPGSTWQQRAEHAEAALDLARRIHRAAAAHDTIGRGLTCGMCAALGINHRPSVVPAPGLIPKGDPR